MTNARKSREKHRMEEKQIIDEQFEKERIKAMAAAYEVYTCTGTQTHKHGCDGNCGIRKLGDLEIQIIEEHKKWEERGMLPLGTLEQLKGMPGIPVDILKVSVALSALTKILTDKLGIDEDEMNFIYQKMYLERLVGLREANEDAIQEAHRHAQIAAPGSQVAPQLIVPENAKRKMMH
jgi:hypothetical protein